MDKFKDYDSKRFEIKTGDWNEYLNSNYKYQKYICILDIGKIYTYLGIAEFCNMSLKEFDKCIKKTFNGLLYQHSECNIWFDKDEDVKKCKDWLDGIFLMHALVQNQ